MLFWIFATEREMGTVVFAFKKRRRKEKEKTF